MMSQAFVPRRIEAQDLSRLSEGALILAGTFYLACLAQVSIPLPYTPVPITGQTFGVASLGLLLGGKRAMAVFSLYLLEGALGLPVFAGLARGFFWGATSGYLLGMALGIGVIGWLSDRGFGKTFGRALFACYCGSFLTFIGGLLVLSQFVPSSDLLATGLFPFLLGDFLKNTVAALAVARLNREA